MTKKGVNPSYSSVFAERVQAGAFIDIDINRSQAAVYGLNIADVHNTLETVLGGNVPSTVIEGRERYAIQVRYAADFRSDIQAVRNVLIPTPKGTFIRLEQIATVSVTEGAPMISSENGKIIGFVFVDTSSDVGLEDYVEVAKSEIAKKVKLPERVRIEFTGQFEALKNAKATLKLVVPLTLVLILFLLYLNTKSIWEVGIVISAVPFSLIGAFWLMWILNYKLSIASWVGILALAGLDAETGVVMLLYLTRAYDQMLLKEKRPSWAMLVTAIREGAVHRIRPKIMTVAAALLGLLPVMWSSGTGAEVMKRIAAPMVGGVVTSGLLELLVYPALFALWKERESKIGVELS